MWFGVRRANEQSAQPAAVLYTTHIVGNKKWSNYSGFFAWFPEPPKGCLIACLCRTPARSHISAALVCKCAPNKTGSIYNAVIFLAKSRSLLKSPIIYAGAERQTAASHDLIVALYFGLRLTFALYAKTHTNAALLTNRENIKAKY